MGITIKDVAKAANTSISTVSKVINGSYTISEGTTERVKNVIEELGYKPNARAQTLARKATKNAAFLTQLQKNAAFENPHMFEIISGAEHTLAKRGFTLQLIDCDSTSVCEIAKDIMERKRADGLLLHASVVNKELTLMMKKYELPHIVIGMPDFPTSLCWIDNNNQLAGEMAANHLMDQGYTRIAYIGGKEEDKISQNRLKGCMEAFKEEGLDINQEYLVEGNPTVDDGFLMTKKLLNLSVRPDAIICANNYLAFGCVNAIKEAVLQIPDDIAVITFDDYPFTKIMHPMISTVSIDVYDMGKQAGDMLVKKIKNPKLQIQTFATLPELLIRNSTVGRK